MPWTSFKKTLIGMAGAFNANINEATLAWYQKALEDLGPEKACRGLNSYSRTMKTRALPTPGQIRDMVEPDSSDAQAKEASARIIQAVGKFGYNRPQEARTFIGELGWACVTRMGGWLHICEGLGVTIQQTTF